MKRHEWAIAIATGYLLGYVLLFQTEAPLWLLSLFFLLSPVPVFWMAYQILRNAAYHGPELEKGEEFGYQDADKNQLGMF